MKQVTRCPECDEPEFMCCCSKEFVGAEVTVVYHKGLFVDGKQLESQMFFLEMLPTVIIGKRAFNLICPDRHFGGNVLMGVR